MEVWGGNQATDVGVSMTGLDAWVYSKPLGDSSAGGGDVHYVSSCASGSITRLLLADVSGHGSVVADIASQLRDLMRQQVNRVSQDQVIEAINHQFAKVGDAGLFATALVFTFFAPRQKLTLSNAGHPPPLLYRERDRSWTLVPNDAEPPDERLTNLPLGVIDDTQFHQYETTLKAGDMVLCYSDALTEAVGSDGKAIGTQGLLDIVRQLPEGEPHEIIRQLLNRLDEVCEDNLNGDDVTVMLFRRDAAATRVNVGRLLAAPIRMAMAKLAGSK